MFKTLGGLWARASSAGNYHLKSDLLLKANRISNQFILLYLGVIFVTALFFSLLYYEYHVGRPLYWLYPALSWGYCFSLLVFFGLKARTGYVLVFDILSYAFGLAYIIFIVIASGRSAWLYLFFMPLAYLPFFLVTLHYILRLLGNLGCFILYVLCIRYVFTHEAILPLGNQLSEASYWISVIALPVTFFFVNLILYLQNRSVIHEFIEGILQRLPTTETETSESKARITLTQIEILSLFTVGFLFLPLEGVMYPVLLTFDTSRYINYDLVYGISSYCLLVLFLGVFKFRKSISVGIQGLVMTCGLILCLLQMVIFAGIPAYLFLITVACSIFFFTRVIRRELLMLTVSFIAIAFAAGITIARHSEPWFPVPEEFILFSEIMMPTLVFILTSCIAFVFARETSIAEENLEVERDRSDELLRNILPSKVADELKLKGKAEPVRYEMVSVLFTDFVGFTKIAQNMSSEELIDELDKCFSYFDSVTRQYNLEKIKTIGDSYMLAGGLPETNATHAIDCCLAAIEIQSFMNQMKNIKEKQGYPYWELRLGIHSGSLVAGVIGEMKFAYDVFGDTVNSASRMEASGVSGKINISEKTYELIKDFFACTFRGQIESKHQGTVGMYFVDAIGKDMSVDGEGRVPNDAFLTAYDLLKNK